MKKVFVVIVTYNTGVDWIEKCLGSLQKSTIPLKTIVIDNASTDETLSIIKEKEFDIDIIESSENLGFAKANNLGMKKAYENGADYIFLLNHDAWIEPNTIEKLIYVHQESQEFGIVSPIHLNGEGDLLDWNFTSYISKKSDDGRKLYTSLLKQEPLDNIYEIDFINAAAWLLSRECIKRVGFFDDVLFPHYGEDNHFVQRVKYHELKLGVVPTTFIYHDREARSGQKNNVFSSDKELLLFKYKTCDVLQEKVDEIIHKDLKKTRTYVLKSLIKLNFSLMKKYLKIYSEKKSILPLIKERRSINRQRYE